MENIIVNAWKFILAGLLMFFFGYLFVFIVMSITPQENTRRVLRVVESICEYSTNNTSNDAQRACQLAQNASNTEYLCSIGGKCWAEDKSK